MKKWRKLPYNGLEVGARVVGKGGGHIGFSGVVKEVQLDPGAESGIARIDVMNHGGKVMTGISHDTVWDKNTQKWGARGDNGTLYFSPSLPDDARYKGGSKPKNGLKRAYHRKSKEIVHETIKDAKKGYITRGALLSRRCKLQQEIEWIDGLLG